MRRNILLALAVIFTLLAGNNAFAATAKAGAKCTKVGVTAVANNLKFTCIKKGKAFVWDKGVKVVKATPKPTASASIAPTPTPTATVSSTAAGYTKAEVAMHVGANDCWSYVDGKVYNFTLWVKEHPGGVEVITGMCGGDGAPSFRGHHGLEVDSYLLPYLIGPLK